jgi:hypothetical protein
MPILGMLALTRITLLRERNGVRRVATQWALDAIAVLATLAAVFAPYWTEPSMVSEMVSEPGRLYANPIWHIPASILRVLDQDAGATFETITRLATQFATVAVIAMVLIRFAQAVWHAPTCGHVPPSWTRPLLAAWAGLFAVLAYLPVNVHAWYWTWPVVPIALLVTWDGRDETAAWPSHRWFTPWLIATALLTLIYHTRIVHP